MTTNTENRKALGRGLAALLGESGQVAKPSSAEMARPAQSIVPTQQIVTTSIKDAEIGLIDLDLIEANPDQPRKVFEASRLEDLAASIREQGVVQPISVRKGAAGKYLIVAGERRWRAAKIAGLKRIPAYVRSQNLTTLDHDVASIVENIQREDLSPMELAVAYERLLKTGQFTQETLAKKLGVSRAAIANSVRLLKLPSEVQELLAQKTLSEGHARVLLSLENANEISDLASRAVSEQLSVRAVEELVRIRLQKKDFDASNAGLSDESLRLAAANNASNNNDDVKSEAVMAIENELRQLFGTKVVVKGRKNRGCVEIYYTGNDSMNRILHMLRGLKG